MTEQIKNGTIARIEVTRGTLTEYPLAEKVRGGWQNGVMFYPDAEVTDVGGRYACMDKTGADEARRLLALASVRPSQEWPDQTGETKADLLAVAQVHATLALVEQQRIANLIAYVGVAQQMGPGERPTVAEAADLAVIQAAAREGLGL